MVYTRYSQDSHYSTARLAFLAYLYWIQTWFSADPVPFGWEPTVVKSVKPSAEARQRVLVRVAFSLK